MQRYDGHAQASAGLASMVAADLAAAIDRRAAASLAVPGGTTPGEFLAGLSQQELDWRRLTVTLTDERWVEPANARSNAGLVARTLGHSALPYAWFPLWRGGISPEDAVARLESESAVLPWPLDVVVLGMGEDGHVASLFPGDESGFAVPPGRRFVAVRGPGGEPRISLVADSIVEARRVYLLLQGARKQAVLAAAVDGDLPVGRILAARADDTVIIASD
jgi:6-phosphogluconolactonase